MLAARLLSKGGYDCEREIRTLEMLKIRFGEAELHQCEVMLRDMADSKRMDASIRNMGPPMSGPSTPLHAHPARTAGAGDGGVGGVTAVVSPGVSPLATPSPGGVTAGGLGGLSSPPTLTPPAGATPAGGAPATAAAPAAALPPLPPGTAAALTKLRSSICSHLFWPSLEEQELELPPELKAAMEVRGGCGCGCAYIGG